MYLLHFAKTPFARSSTCRDLNHYMFTKHFAYSAAATDAPARICFQIFARLLYAHANAPRHHRNSRIRWPGNRTVGGIRNGRVIP